MYQCDIDAETKSNVFVFLSSERGERESDGSRRLARKERLIPCNKVLHIKEILSNNYVSCAEPSLCWAWLPIKFLEPDFATGKICQLTE